MSFSLIGTGSAYPAHTLSNEQLSQMVDTSDEWITTRTGIHSRHILTDETLTDLVVRAARSALQDADVKPEELDLILCATVRGDSITPSEACILQKELGACCPSMDINAACSGFLYALDVADGYFARKRAKKVLVVAAEAMSRMTDWTDRASCVLFGDGAGAAVLCVGDDLRSIRITACGNTESLVIPNVRGLSPFTQEGETLACVHMNGQDVYKFAVSSMVRDIDAVAADAGIAQEDIDYVLPHQANIRIIDAARSRLRIRPDRYLTNIDRFGNTSAASIPILLDECNRKQMFRKGDLLVFSAFGGGFTTGACVLRWSK